MDKQTTTCKRTCLADTIKMQATKRVGLFVGVLCFVILTLVLDSYLFTHVGIVHLMRGHLSTFGSLSTSNDRLTSSVAGPTSRVVEGQADPTVEAATWRNRTLFTAPWTVLGARETEKLMLMEVERYGTQVKLNATVDTLTAITFLPTYKNPCWYNRDMAKDGDQRIRVTLECLPYFLVVGVGKCGTTHLFTALQSNTQITPSNNKELFWWNRSRTKDQYISHYTKKFSNAKQRISTTVTSVSQAYMHPIVTYEGTPGYFMRPMSGSSPKRSSAHDIHTVLPNAKIIVTLRNPTERLYSDYNHFNKKKSPEKFHKAVLESIEMWKKCVEKRSIRQCAYSYDRTTMPLALTFSMYDVYAEEWINEFSRDQIYFSQLEEYQQNETHALNKMFVFLKLEPTAKLSPLEEEIKNKKSYPQGPMLASTRQILDEFFAPHKQRLAQLLQHEKWLWN